MKSNVKLTRELNLCLSCEICNAICPKKAIKMDYLNGQFLPKINENCIQCEKCLKICPGIDIDPFNIRNKKVDKDFDGKYLNSFIAFSKNIEIRKNSASGGIITDLIKELIRNKEYTKVFVLSFEKFKGKPARLKPTNNKKTIYSSARSKYIPVSAYEIINILEKEPQGKYVIIGTPCIIQGIKKYLSENKKNNKEILFLGLFCDNTMNFNILKYFEDKYKKSQEKISKFYFKTKEESGWPGDPKICFDSGRKLILDKSERRQIKKFFQLNRCLFCLSGKLNPLADISFGDCYIKFETDFMGKSNVIIRTKKGSDIFSKYKYLFNVKEVDIDEIKYSQGLQKKSETLNYVKLFFNDNEGANYELKNKTLISKKLGKLKEYIRWGRKYNLRRIKLHLLISKCLNHFKRGRIAFNVGLVILIRILNDYLLNKFKGKKVTFPKNNILIVGGGFSNKGAQAMTFTSLDQLKKRFPEKSFYLLSEIEYNRTKNEEKKYNFSIIPWNIKIKLVLLGFPKKLFEHHELYNLSYIEEVIKNTEFFGDVSGYALSSQWGFLASFDYILNIMVAKKFNTSYYILPQSIGPFNYPLKYKFFLWLLMKLYLTYPKKIFVREEEGIQFIKKFTKKNIIKSLDIVLQGKKYDMRNIYSKKIVFTSIEIEKGSVAIIPNFNLFRTMDDNQIYAIYKNLIEKCLNAKKIVYILRHGDSDLSICEDIKNFFSDDENVKLISNDMNCIEFEEMIKQFDFMIASRYHAIIHSFKNSVPAFVIGWATKYSELLDTFHQFNYYFDVREGIELSKIESSLVKLIKNYQFERNKIKEIICILEDKNAFELIFECENEIRIS